MIKILRDTLWKLTRMVLFAAFLAAPVAARCEAVPASATHAWMSELGAQDRASSLLVPLLAQAAPDQAIETFLNFLAKLFIIIGAIAIGYGGYEVARGRVVEGLLSVFGGLVLALAIPLMRWLTKLGSGGP
jgi:hypothetical protein